MRRSQLSFLLTIATTVLLLLGVLLGWGAAKWLTAEETMSSAWRLGLILGVAGIAGALLWLHTFVRIYFFRVKQLITDGQLILQTNPAHRLQPEGPRDLQALMGLLNQFADRFQRLLAERDSEIARARADLEEERNLLATLMADLSDGVVVCNRDGRILLYNRHARTLLASRDLDTQAMFAEPTAHYIGLGRSIFGLLDRNALTYALSHLDRHNAAHAATTADGITGPTAMSPPAGTAFITTTAAGALLRVQMMPLPATDSGLPGFILTLHDMTERLHASSRRDFLLQRLTERMRGGLGNIRAAIELLEQFPTMAPAQLQRFQQVIDREATGLSSELEQTMRDFADDLRAQWRFEEMAGADLLWAIEHYLADHSPLQVTTTRGDTSSTLLWLRIDSYAVVHGLVTAVRMLQNEFSIAAINIQLRPLHTHQAPEPTAEPTEDTPGNPLTRNLATDEGGRLQRFATLDVRWNSQGIATEAWLDWKERVVTIDAGDATLTLREVAERHGSEVWFQHDPSAGQSYFRLLLPLADAPPPAQDQMPILSQSTVASRPHYYDFDLFGQKLQQTEWGPSPLHELAYTIFDTETTGLDPQHDEIVAIGAVRVLNGRVLRQEIFDQLIDPQRPIPHIATAIHGIDQSMVVSQPTIELVLPRFARFAEETLLVGHNLAFDLRMFAAKEARTGIRFDGPVLDTLLLSEVLHPDEENHELETIALRLGVNVLGRHTALGDAFVAAEIFLRMLPLLKAQGINTLDEAVAASKATYLARVTY